MPSSGLPEFIGYFAGGVAGITSSIWFPQDGARLVGGA